ncbi:MAG: hypothetical protein OK456_11595 [Thaumarchaeota archaeon]|nr:hypothetical protein [Nitrososphaerota archaeon]
MNPRLGIAMNEKVLRMVLGGCLVLSALLGSYILATDSYLWAEAPLHAYGLIAFVAIDLVAVVGIYVLPRLARVVALLLPAVQLAAMAGDLYTGLGSPGSVVQAGVQGVSAQRFRVHGPAGAPGGPRGPGIRQSRPAPARPTRRRHPPHEGMT